MRVDVTSIGFTKAKLHKLYRHCCVNEKNCQGFEDNFSSMSADLKSVKFDSGGNFFYP